MGTSKKQKKRYKHPLRTWDTTRIKRDKDLKKEHGFKTKRELWKMESKLRSIRKRARDLIALKALGKGSKEEKEFVRKISSSGLVDEKASLDDVLDLELEDLMGRRLQSVVFKKGMSRSIKEARQMIAHHHITIDKKLVDAPNYMVKRNEEEKIKFSSRSPFASKGAPTQDSNEVVAKGA
jgi:small subunit ribosomal protein S4